MPQRFCSVAWQRACRSGGSAAAAVAATRSGRGMPRPRAVCMRARFSGGAFHPERCSNCCYPNGAHWRTTRMISPTFLLPSPLMAAVLFQPRRLCRRRTRSPALTACRPLLHGPRGVSLLMHSTACAALDVCRQFAHTILLARAAQPAAKPNYGQPS